MSDEMSEFRRMGRKIFQSSKIIAVAKLVRIFFPNVFRLLKMRTFPAEVNDFFISVVSDTLNHRQQHNIRRNDFLQMLAEIRNTSATAYSSADDEESAAVGNNALRISITR